MIRKIILYIGETKCNIHLYMIQVKLKRSANQIYKSIYK